MKGRKKLYIIMCILCCLLGCSQNNGIDMVLNAEEILRWQEVTRGDENETLSQYVNDFLECHDDVDYGLAYGITAVLCDELELCEVNSDYTNEELAAYFSDAEQMYLLDFTLPMFETYFFEEDTVAYVQAAAISFAEYMNAQGELDELYQICLSDTDEDATKLVEMKNEWLDAIGVDKDYVPFAELTFAYNDMKLPEEYPYVIIGTEANWYFHPTDVKEYGYKAFVEEYLTTEELLELDFPEARELFKKYLPEEVSAIDICTAFYTKHSSFGAWYRHLENRIDLLMDWEKTRRTLLHEYVHYLTVGVAEMTSPVGAFAEGLAEEAAVWGCTNHLQEAYAISVSAEDGMEKSLYWDEEKGHLSMQKATMDNAQFYYLGLLVGEKYTTVSADVTVRAEKVNAVGKLSYQEMASLTHYLIELYGRDAVYEGFRNYDSFMELVGKEFIVLYDEWGAWNVEQCNKLGLEITF